MRSNLLSTLKTDKEILEAMGEPGINPEEIVFHSIRHTSAGVKLRLSGGDLKAVQGDGGWSTPDMVTKRYAHILDEDRRTLAAEMEKQFYQTAGNLDAPKPVEQPTPAAPVIDASALATLLTSNPELLAQVLQSIQSANRA